MNRGMGCSVCLWLFISLGGVWGVGSGVRETVLGTLGKATILQIPPDLQQLTLHFGSAVWKRDTEDPQRKLVLLRYMNGTYINYMEERARFHKSNFALEILNTSRQDRQLYQYIINKGPEEKVWPVQLEVFEPVSDPSIEILNWMLANGSCTITLNCTAERGDHVSYIWGSGDTGPSEFCSHNGSLLHLSYPLHNTSIACSCTASNPVSSRVGTFNSSECSYEQEGSARLSLEQLVVLVVVPIVTVMMLTLVFMVTRLAMPTAGQEREHHPLAEDSAVHTIYSQVQRVEKRTPTTEHPSCTTIYAAATDLPLDKAPTPGRAPQSSELPTQQGHPSLLQSPDKEPMTVYASVMLPVA